MNVSRLTSLVVQAAANVVARPSAPGLDSWTTELLPRFPDVEEVAFTALVDGLRSEGELKLFDHTLQIIAGAGHSSGHLVTYEDLARWLVSRALDLGADQALSYLVRYVTEDDFLCSEVLALAGLVPEEPIDLGQGVRLIPIGDLPGPLPPWLVTDGTLLSTAHSPPSPTAALTFRFRAPKQHESATSTQQRPEFRLLEGLPNLMQSCFLLTLIGPSAPVPLGQWTVADHTVPCAQSSGGMSQFVEGRVGSVTKLNRTHTEGIQELFATFHGLPSSRRQALMIPITRLNFSLKRVSRVDTAIDLGIALEALFLADMAEDRSELSFRLRLRAARFLESAPEERRKLMQHLTRFYRLRSEAVHSGSISAEIDGRPSGEVIDETKMLCARAIERMILDGSPEDWNYFVLS